MSTAKYKYGEQTIESSCEHCGNVFSSFVSAERKFCSKTCFYENRKKDALYCIICENKIVGNAKKYCSISCRTVDFTGRTKPHTYKREVAKCEQCGKEMECGGRAKHKKNARFCSNICSGLSARNTIDEFWRKEGRTSAANWNDLRDMIINEQDSKCALCGNESSKFQIHHIIPRSFGGCHERHNLIASCERCHWAIDKILLMSSRNKPDIEIHERVNALFDLIGLDHLKITGNS